MRRFTPKQQGIEEYDQISEDLVTTYKISLQLYKY